MKIIKPRNAFKHESVANKNSPFDRFEYFVNHIHIKRIINTRCYILLYFYIIFFIYLYTIDIQTLTLCSIIQYYFI